MAVCMIIPEFKNFNLKQISFWLLFGKFSYSQRQAREEVTFVEKHKNKIQVDVAKQPHFDISARKPKGIVKASCVHRHRHTPV